MKSSSGTYYIGLDHIRALAAFMVFSWHFIHAGNGQLAPPPIFPMSLLTEGHTGVAVFMTLSGYLFAKLLAGKDVNYVSFLWNRFLRLAPLLFIVLLLVGYQRYISGRSVTEYLDSIKYGFIKPNLPNGGWSITAELHFYIILPLLLYFSKRVKYSLVFVLVSAILLRLLFYLYTGEVQRLSYWTIGGRIDQFLLGIIAYQFRSYITSKHLVTIGIIILFSLFYRYFDSLGGFYTYPSYPSPSILWVILPTIEGIAYATAIAWYDTSFSHSTGKFSRFIAQIGTYSYSIYLLHFFIVFKLSTAINAHVLDLSNLHTALLFATLSFFVMVPIGYISYRFLESPFLKYRVRYIRT